MKGRCISAALAATALAACSPTGGSKQKAASQVTQEPATTANSTPAPAPEAADSNEPAETAASATTGGDGSPVRLSPLSSDDIQAADLAGELGCSFSSGEGEGETLLVAMGDVASEEPAFGVVKVGDSAESVSARGGFDGMLRGATFVGRGKTIEIERTSSQPIGGGESPPYPARLTYKRADGASRSSKGLWTCGP